MKARYIIIGMAAMAALSACQQGADDKIEVKRTLPDMECTIDEPTFAGESRTSMDENKNVLWAAGDEVTIFFGSTENQHYKLKTGAGTTSASFTLVPSEDFTSGVEIERNVAYYPYNENITYKANGEGNATLSVELPATQSYAKASFGAGFNPMAAVTQSAASKSLIFRNVLGCLKLQLKGTATIKRIEFEGNNGERIAGAATVTAVYGETPAIVLANDAATKLTLDCGEGVALSASEATPFMIMLPPQVFEGGFKFTIFDNEGKAMEKSTTKQYEIVRSFIQPMSAFTYEGATLESNIAFEDENFKAALLLLTVDGYKAADYPAKTKIDANSDGEISYEEAAAVTSITVDTYTANITSMRGIECFTNITYLSCSGSGWSSTNQQYLCSELTSLDVSTNTKLKELYCGYNKLTALDVSKNSALTDLECSFNQLTALDVSKNSALTTLRCYSNQLTALDVSKNTALYYFDCSSNQLTALDVSNNTVLSTLFCGNNQLTAFDLNNNTALEELYCGSNQLTALDVSNNTALTGLYCFSNQLTALDVSNNTALTFLSCDSNQLTTLDVSKTNLHNSPYNDPLDCSPMNDDSGNNLLSTLYIAEGQVINYINGTGDYARNADYIPAATQIIEGNTGDDYAWKTKDFYHRSLAMKFTATWCGYCPAMATNFHAAQADMPDKIEILNLHPLSSALAFNGTATLATQLAVSGYPSGFVDLRRSVYSAWSVTTALTETEKNYPTSSGIAFTSTLSGTSLSANINLYIKKADSYKVTVLLMEDKIVSSQADNTNGTQDNYVHNDIARMALTDISGEAFTTTADNQIVEKKYSVTIPSSYNTSNLRILVYVQRVYGSQTVLQTADYGNYYVDNCASGKVGYKVNLATIENATGGNEDITTGDEINAPKRR